MRRFVSVLLAMLLLLQLPVSAAKTEYQDVQPTDWFADCVEYVRANGLMMGTSQTHFSPNAPMTRAMLVAVLHRMEGSPASGKTAPFVDLKKGEYYCAAVDWAYENHIVSGVSKTHFAPDTYVTREQIVTILFRYAGWKGRDTSARAALYGYYDLVKVSDYAWDAMCWAVAEGIITGSGEQLDPGDYTLRSQCAAILTRYLDPERALTYVPWEAPQWEEPKYQGKNLRILMYHSVVPDGEVCNDWTVNVSTFRAHMQWLKEHGYETVLPGELAAGKPLPRKAVMITFDDGYANNYTLAFPVLLEYGYKATVSVVASSIGSGHYLTWEMCRRMAGSGLVEIGSHTYDLHEYPGILRQEGETQTAYERRVLKDLQSSIDLIEQEMGGKPNLFAYPYGLRDSWAEGFIEANFPLSVITDSGVNQPSEGLHCLLRTNIASYTDLSKILP